MGYYTVCQSPIGDIYIVLEEKSITSVHIGIEDFEKLERNENLIYSDENPVLINARKQMEEYFAGKRREFDLPILEKGTSFQRKVWEQLTLIPYGETASYQDVAIAIGKKEAVRAIGQANKANNLPIIIPCHRVIGKNQSLTGYAGKRINIKEKLLLLEGASFKR